MDALAKLLEETANKSGLGIRQNKLMFAPDMGGNFNSDGLSFRDNEILAALGKYSNTNGGENFYGYAGAQPFNFGQTRLGGALGGYGSAINNINPLAGLLVSHPIMNGELQSLLSPSFNGKAPSLFIGYNKKF